MSILEQIKSLVQRDSDNRQAKLRQYRGLLQGDNAAELYAIMAELGLTVADVERDQETLRKIAEAETQAADLARSRAEAAELAAKREAVERELIETQQRLQTDLQQVADRCYQASQAVKTAANAAKRAEQLRAESGLFE